MARAYASRLCDAQCTVLMLAMAWGGGLEATALENSGRVTVAQHASVTGPHQRSVRPCGRAEAT
jgi:hypothetical protein